MSRERKILVWNVVLMLLLGVAALTLRLTRINRRPPILPVSISGAVLTAESDPRKQTPVAGATVTLKGGQLTAETKSDSAGHFAVTLLPGVEPHQPVTLVFTQAEHKPVEITEIPRDQLYIVRMEPLVRARPSNPEQPKAQGKAVGEMRLDIHDEVFALGPFFFRSGRLQGLGRRDFPVRTVDHVAGQERGRHAHRAGPGDVRSRARVW